MSNPTLIVGFEDVMSYIKNQDQRIKELEKENKKLQEEWDILNRFCGVPVKNNGQAVVNWICSFFTIEDKFYELEKENKKLKQKATAWKIIMRNDWGNISELFDKQQCLDLIECGECEPEDFEDHVEYNRVDYEDDEVDYYIDAGRKAVLKDGRVVTSKD